MNETENRLQRAKSFEAKEDYQRAINEYKEITKSHGQDQDIAHQHLAIIFAKLENYQEAIRHSQKALSLNSDLAFPHHVMAYSLYKTGELEEAVSELQKEIKKSPPTSKAVSIY